MAIPYSDINQLLSSWASNEVPLCNFSVSHVLSVLGLDSSFYNSLLAYLLKKNGDELIAKKMVFCPKNHKGQTFLLHEEVDPDRLFECWCGEQYYYDEAYTTIVFQFTDHFLAQETKKKVQLLEA